MEDEVLFRFAVWSGFAMALGICSWMSKHNNMIPYGRHHETAAAATSLPLILVMLPTRLAWSLMESPPLLLTLPLFSLGRNASLPIPRALALLFLAHYAHRALVYPLRMRPTRTRNVPLLIFLAAVGFNVYNTYIQMRSLSHYTHYPSAWFSSPQFVFGITLFISGMAINIWADSTLMSLRKLSASKSIPDASKAYRIPGGRLFELVSCPNYFGELLEWLGWAFATWSVAGLVFFILCVSNLVPRAVAHHQWLNRRWRLSSEVDERETKQSRYFAITIQVSRCHLITNL